MKKQQPRNDLNGMTITHFS